MTSAQGLVGLNYPNFVYKQYRKFGQRGGGGQKIQKLCGVILRWPLAIIMLGHPITLWVGGVVIGEFRAHYHTSLL